MKNARCSLIVISSLLMASMVWTINPKIQSEGPVVLTSQGAVRGVPSSDGQYTMFMGIPYATVDSDNPFGDALPGPTFKGVYEANDDSAMCPQREEFNNTLVGNLDCLHINIYVPIAASIDNPLPVMVWIHGGRWILGFSGQYVYGPQYIVKHNVILVTLNYRLGPYGFMCLDIPSVPGNTGLKDQRAGVRWIKENIAAFGGDAGSITAFGNSAGSMSLDYHILSSGSNGLFHRVILQSGSTLADDFYLKRSRRPNSVPLELAAYLGYNYESIEEALDMLKDAPTNDLIRAGEILGISYSPCVEKSFEGVESLILDYQSNLLSSGQFESIPLLIGHTNHEMTGEYFKIMDDKLYIHLIQDVIFRKLNTSLLFLSESKTEVAAKLVREFYIGMKPLNRGVIYELGDFESDLSFNHPTERLLKYYMEKSDKPIYQYVFAYSGRNNMGKHLFNITVEGAVHADEIGYLFKPSYVPDVKNQDDKRVIDQMTAMWTNFAKYGDPTPETSELLPVRWPPVTRDRREYLNIDKELVVDRKPFHRRISFWDLLFLSTVDKDVTSGTGHSCL